jgi:hypothetical protein
MAAKNRVGFAVAAAVAAVGLGLAAMRRKADTVNNQTPVINHDSTAEEKRAAVIAAAGSQIGKSYPAPYWYEVYGSYPGRSYAWCGVFALWALHVAGVTDQPWKVGIGFIYPLGLRQTITPEPGDIAYFQKKQHHAIVGSVNSDGTVSLINGNGTGGQVSESRPDVSDVTAFYSIRSLL